MESISGDFRIGTKQRFALVVSEFNRLITARLSEAAVDCLVRHGAAEGQVVEVLVPGALEIAVAAAELAKSGKFAAVICLGCVIRGETDHYDHVASNVAKGVAAIGHETGVPTIFGVITADTVEQALNRAGLKHGNAGWNAAMAAMAAASVMAKIRGIK